MALTASSTLCGPCRRRDASGRFAATREAAARVSALAFPTTLVHGDFHAGSAAPADDILVVGAAYPVVSYGILRALEPATRYTMADGATSFLERLEHGLREPGTG